jgi:hypothetical protein
VTVTSNITNAQLAAQIQALITSWQTRETQMIAWLAGAAGGGDFSNGTYPLSDAFGNVKYVESPAQMSADVTTTVDSATAQATASAASATTASAAQAAALTARNLASTYATNAAASATQAANSQSAAASSAAAALASKNSATASAAAAAASASSMGSSVTASAASASAAAASQSAAAASASAAAASAAAAATFNPALYATLTGATFTGNLTFTGQGRVLNGPNNTGIYLNFTDGYTYIDSQDGVNFRAAGDVVLGKIDNAGTFWATASVVANSGFYTHNGSARQMLLDENDGWMRLNNATNFSNGVFTPGDLRVDGSLYTFLGTGNNAFLHHASGHTSGAVTVSTAAPSGGSDGDIWIQH